MPLTDTACRNAKPTGKRWKLADGGGLFLQIEPSGSKLWRQAYRFNGKQKLLSHGAYPTVTLSKARSARDVAKVLLAEGIDPSEKKKAEKVEAKLAADNSFEAIATEWFGLREDGWTAGYSERIWRRLEADVFPKIGQLPIRQVEPPMLLGAIREVEARGAIVLAKRLLQICGQIFRFAVASGRATRDPSQDLRGALRSPSMQKHRASLRATELGPFLRALAAYPGEKQTALALSLVVHTMVRTAEARFAKWEEFEDLRGSEPLWRIGRTEGFSVCLVQETTAGKTLCARCAQSLTTKARERDLKNFGDSAGWLADALPALGGMCVGFGDIKNDVTPRAMVEKMKTLVFRVAGGQTRQRKGEDRRPNPEFTIPLLSAETPLTELFAREKMTFEGGESVRLLEIPVPHSSDGGIFAGSSRSSAELAAEFEEFLGSHHGSIMDDWVAKIVRDRGKRRSSKLTLLTKHIAARERAFISTLGTLPPPYLRIAARFALLFATATVAEVAAALPVSITRTDAAIRRLFWRCVDNLRARDKRELEGWRMFHDLLDHLPTASTGKSLTEPSALVGFIRRDAGAEVAYLRPEALAATLGKPFVDQTLMPQLIRLGCIRKARDGGLTIPVKQAGIKGRPRLHRVNLSKLPPRSAAN